MMDEPLIRQEGPDDHAAIRRVNELAFGGPGEANLVDALRAAGAVTLSLVARIGADIGADSGADIVGHILFSPVAIKTSAGTSAAVGLAPMAVLPGRQRMGIGSRLVREGLAELGRRGHAAVIVLGHPDYYPRFGFEPASRFGLRWEHECPDQAFMARELRPGALAGPGGVVCYRPEFAAV
jgi:putative acetyltransferase